MRHISLWWCVFLLLLASGFTILQLDFAPVYNDEYQSVSHTGYLEVPNSIPQIIDSIAHKSPQHVPLYFISLAGWIAITGLDPVTMRYLSLLPFLLAIALGYQVGKQIVDDKYGRWLAFFVATSAFAIFYAHQIRMYTFSLFFTLCLILCYWRIYVSSKRARPLDWLGLWLSSVLLIYTHYIGIFALIAIGLYHLTQFSWRRRWWAVVLVEALAGSTFLFWLNIFISGTRSRADLSEGALSFLEALYHLMNISSNGLFIIGFALTMLALVQFRKTNKNKRFMIIISVLSVFSILIVNQFTTLVTIDRMRYAMILIPFLSLLFALGIHILSDRKWLVVIVAISWCIAGFVFNQNPLFQVYTNWARKQFSRYPPYHIYARILDDLPGFDEPLITVSPDVDVMNNVRTFYAEWLHRDLNHIWDEPDASLAPLVNLRLDIIQDDLSILVAHDADVALDNVPSYETVIAKDFKNCETVYSNGSNQIDYYVRDVIPCELITDHGAVSQVTFSNGIRLENLLLTEQSSNVYRIYTWWDRASARDASLGFWLSVRDASGNEMLYTTNTMPPKSIGVNDLDLTGLRDGTYEIYLTVFDINSGAPIVLADGSQGLLIGNVHVAHEG